VPAALAVADGRQRDVAEGVEQVALAIDIDELTPDQAEYLTSWQSGT